MSREVIISISLNRIRDVRFPEIVKRLVAAGWSTSDRAGRTTYLPVGDNDDFNWICGEIGSKELADLLQAKEDNLERIGIDLIWTADDVRVTLLAESAYDLCFAIQSDRVTIRPEIPKSVTDFSWYLRRTSEVLVDAGMPVEKIEAIEF